MQRRRKQHDINIDKFVGNKIRKLRYEKGLTQVTLANQITPPLSYQQLQKYEYGKTRIYASVLYQIANILDVNIDEFLPQ